jgi:acylphosphatase
MKEAHLIFKGRVQGVGFRATLQRHALKLSLKGRAKNLDDGSVEVFVQGEENEIKDFITLVKSQSKPAQILEIEVSFKKIEQPFPNFEIVYE